MIVTAVAVVADVLFCMLKKTYSLNANGIFSSIKFIYITSFFIVPLITAVSLGKYIKKYPELFIKGETQKIELSEVHYLMLLHFLPLFAMALVATYGADTDFALLFITYYSVTILINFIDLCLFCYVCKLVKKIK